MRSQESLNELRYLRRIQEEVERNSDIQDASGARGRKIWRHIRSSMSFRGEREEEDEEVTSEP